MKAITLYLAAAYLAGTMALVLYSAAIDPGYGAPCHTDTECAELCPEGARDLPPDHPDYCDGGPQS